MNNCIEPGSEIPQFSDPLIPNQKCNYNEAANDYDPISESCKCGTSTPCSGATPYCRNQKCVCSKVTSSFVKGDHSTQGTCSDSDHKCSHQGICWR